MLSWKFIASVMALRCEAGCVPICSNLRMSSCSSVGAAIIGQIFGILFFFDVEHAVPIGASSHLCSDVPK